MSRRRGSPVYVTPTARVQRLLRQARKPPDRLGEDEYKVVFHKVYKLMMPAADYDEAEARVAVHDDWLMDSGGRGFLTREAFLDAVFELADVWTLTTSASEYAFFLEDLVRG